jgi:LPXTG-site transpeptidase (sortase) family protein
VNAASFVSQNSFFAGRATISMPSQLKRALPMIMMLVGAMLLVYTGSQYVTMWLRQRELERSWQAQQHSPQKIAAEVELTRISIPKLSFSAVVVEGTDRKSLLLGPGHLKHTAEPGAPGNSVITAHRDTFFRHIGDLKAGDSIIVERNGHAYEYRVVVRRIVPPTEISVVQPTDDNRLTLITCYPTYYIGPAPERLVVVARLEGEPESVARTETAPDQTVLPGDPEHTGPTAVHASQSK